MHYFVYNTYMMKLSQCSYVDQNVISHRYFDIDLGIQHSLSFSNQFIIGLEQKPLYCMGRYLSPHSAVEKIIFSHILVLGQTKESFCIIAATFVQIYKVIGLYTQETRVNFTIWHLKLSSHTSGNPNIFLQYTYIWHKDLSCCDQVPTQQNFPR